MVLECGEIDLARLLQKREAARKEHDGGAASLDENFIRLYWEQMLRVRIGKEGSGGLEDKAKAEEPGFRRRLGVQGCERGQVVQSRPPYAWPLPSPSPSPTAISHHMYHSFITSTTPGCAHDS